MNNIITIFNREFKSYFSSPIAYVVIGLFLVLTGVFFYLLTSSFLQYAANLQWQAARMRQPAPPVNVNHMIIRPLFSNISVITLFVGIGLYLLGFSSMGSFFEGIGLLVGAIGAGTMIAGYLYPNTSEELTNAVEKFEKS